MGLLAESPRSNVTLLQPAGAAPPARRTPRHLPFAHRPLPGGFLVSAISAFEKLLRFFFLLLRKRNCWNITFFCLLFQGGKCAAPGDFGAAREEPPVPGNVLAPLKRNGVRKTEPLRVLARKNAIANGENFLPPLEPA